MKWYTTIKGQTSGASYLAVFTFQHELLLCYELSSQQSGARLQEKMARGEERNRTENSSEEYYLLIKLCMYTTQQFECMSDTMDNVTQLVRTIVYVFLVASVGIIF